MRAIVLENGQYQITECDAPQLAQDEVLIRVASAGVNRADLFQKQGRYPLPEHHPAIPGMEVAGEVIKCGSLVNNVKPGDNVCALMKEGAFAEQVSVPAALTLPVPQCINIEYAAALPEALCTAWISLVWQARIAKGETLLVHGGASGVGIMAIQLAKLLGARVFATAGTEEKCNVCRLAGAEIAVHYPSTDFVQTIIKATAGKGVDVILDMVGGDYMEKNLNILAHGGRLCMIAFLRGAKITANFSSILLKHLSVMGSTLRSRPRTEKEKLLHELAQRVWPALAQGAVKPVIDRTFPLQEAEKALLRMQQGLNVGKILLRL